MKGIATRPFGWVLLAGILSGGCSWLDWMRPGEEGLILNPRDDYLEAQQHNALVVPEDLRNLNNTDPFPIPPTPIPENPSFYPERPPLPDAIYANDNRDEVRLQRLGDRRWLVVPEGPTTAWPKIKQFLAENGVSVTLDAPETGRLNTEWMEIEQTTYRDVIRTLTKETKAAVELDLGQDRYLIKVEQGLRPGTTEVHARHENDSVSLPTDETLVSFNNVISHVHNAEDEFLSEVGAYIAAKVSEQTVSKVALQIGSTQKAIIRRNEQGYPELELRLDYERAWATLGQSLENAEVEVLALDRDSGMFVVHIPPEVFTREEDDGPGFFCRLTFSCDDDKGDALDLQIVVEGSGERYRVIVLESTGDRPVQAEVAQQVLVLIREFAT